MGSEESHPLVAASNYSSTSTLPSGQSVIDLANAQEAKPWTLLHECKTGRWKDRDAEAAGFQEIMLSCTGVLYKDCSPGFCINHQGIIKLSKTSSFFSFRRKSKFTKMAEHFEYNHIPAQLSSIQNFHVKSVLCYREHLVVLHLIRNSTSQLALIDVKSNKFLGIFGQQGREIANEDLRSQLSPDMSRCAVQTIRSRLSTIVIYDISSKSKFTVVTQTEVVSLNCHFAYDPRFQSSRMAVTNFGPEEENSLTLIAPDKWVVIATNHRADDTQATLYPTFKEMLYSPDGMFIIGLTMDTECTCDDRRLRRQQGPVGIAVFIYNADTANTLHCITFQRNTCGKHLCPSNYLPIFSNCSSRMVIAVNDPTRLNSTPYVQVYKLPSPISLKALCRICILQIYRPADIPSLPIPPIFVPYLQFKPEFI